MTDTEAQPPDPSASQPTPAPIAEPVSELPEDAIEAAAQKLNPLPYPWKSLSGRQREYDRGRAAGVLAAALPFLERATRAKIADEIKAQAEAQKPLSHHYAVGVFDGLLEAARVARGGEATE